MTFERSIGELAEGQHGLVSRADVLDLGLSRSQVDRRLASGRWRRVGTGVYAVAGSPSTWSQRVMVVCLEGQALASHRTAAALWRLDGFPEHRVEVTVRRGRRYERPFVAVHESLDLDRIVPVRRRGIPTTPLDRTALDLGSVLPFEKYDILIQRLVASGLLTWRQLFDVLVRHARRGRNGVGRLRAVLDERYGITPAGSDFEVLVERLLVDSGLPTPVRQHRALDTNGRVVAQIDLAYPTAMVAIELDGRGFHSDSEVFERDRSRQNRLVLLGWTVLRFTWKQLLEEPHRIVSSTRAALTA